MLIALTMQIEKIIYGNK